MSQNQNASHHHRSEPPAPSASDIAFGSDAVAEQLSRLNLRYMALVPGSSYRGLHDSIVNYKGNTNPEMLICLHEEHAVAIAHGYAKVMGKPMAVGLHANVGLMHATMTIYNAYCDRVPMLILGATGPLDSTRRRPWIDWIHTAADQAALIRPFIKFDDQPSSPNAAIESLVHAVAATAEKPCAPAYVCLDLGLQEDEVDPKTLRFPDTKRYLQARRPPGPSAENVDILAQLLTTSERPVFLFGRLAPREASWKERISLAEHCNAQVVTDLKQTSSFPTDHPLHASSPGVFTSPQTSEILRSARLIISFDWVDLAGTLKAAHDLGVEPSGKVVQISLDSALHNGWSKDHFGPPPADLHIRADPDETISALITKLGIVAGFDKPFTVPHQNMQPRPSDKQIDDTHSDIFMTDLANVLYSVIPPDDISLVRVPLGWNGRDLRATHPLGFMGMDGGAGIASGPGQIVGTSLALQELGSSLVPVAVIGDGDFCMGSSALWTAAKYRLPCLVIVANNASYYNDEVHQERVAKRRGRPVENKWVGMRLDDPVFDVHKIAQGLGCSTVVDGQVVVKSELENVLKRAVGEFREGKVVVVDVRVLPDGYSAAMSEKSKG